VPQPKRIQLIEAIATQYFASNPADANGRVSVLMVRLEVEAEKQPQQKV
jgi:hypothetical protein